MIRATGAKFRMLASCSRTPFSFAVRPCCRCIGDDDDCGDAEDMIVASRGVRIDADQGWQEQL